MFYYEEVLRALNRARVDYVVFGGVAAILHGVHRATYDIDIMIDLSDNNIEKCFRALQRIGYQPKVPVTVKQFKDAKLRKSWQKEKNMKVFSFIKLEDSFKLIDLSLGDLLEYSKVKKEYKRVGNIKVPVISVDQLKRLKRKAGRPKDLGDLEELERLRKML